MRSPLILASKSPRRYELLKQVGLDFDVIPSEIEENFVPGEAPDQHVIRLAKEKALEVGRRYPDRWVVAADTVVFVHGSVLGKPKGREEALSMLRALSGQEHWVMTGFSVHHLAKGVGDQAAVQTAVKVKPLSPIEMKWYIHTAEPFDKAGGYAIQGVGSFMIESIRGSYTNVVGLPLCELMQMMTRLGALQISENGMRIAE
ncbi:MAG: nucleoside triphosphate pyrophosphatase [Thermodesulfobacteriota bacterium]